MPEKSNYRDDLAERILSEPDKNERRKKITEARAGDEYVLAEEEYREENKKGKEYADTFIANLRNGTPLYPVIEDIPQEYEWQIAKALIDAGMEDDFLPLMGYLPSLSSEQIVQIALRLVDKGKAEKIVKNISDVFHTLTSEEDFLAIARGFIERREGKVLARNIDSWPLSGEYHFELAQQIIEAGNDGEVALIENYDRFYGIPPEKAPEIIELLLSYNNMMGYVIADNFSKFCLPPETHDYYANMFIDSIGYNGACSVGNNLSSFYGLTPEAQRDLFPRLLDEAGYWQLHSLAWSSLKNLDFRSAEPFLKNGEFAKVNQHERSFDPKDSFFQKARSLCLTPSEYYQLRDEIGDFENKPAQERTGHIADLLIQKNWGNSDIAGLFQEGAKIFGSHRMLIFANRPELSRHDAFHAFRAITEMYELSGLSESEFFGSILAQVAKDDSVYPEGTANHRLNAIAQSTSFDIEAVLERAKEYSDLPRLQDLVSTFGSTHDVFASWHSLKKYAELVEILAKAELLKELQELKASGNDKLYHFIETLAFHPASGISIEKVMLFWKNPREFFDIPEIHASEYHELKKPSHYFDIRHLDLSPEDLRDAIADGTLDSLQAFEPMEARYIIMARTAPLIQRINQSLGSRQRGEAGLAKNPKLLFSHLNIIFKEHGMKVQDIVAGKTAIPQDAIDAIERELNNREYGLPQNTESYTVLAKISLKSDPDGIVAGNDTACCMPFGAGKNNVYMCNPITAQFTLQVQREDGAYKTIAQSVLTKDRDIGIEVSRIMEQLGSTNKNIADIIPQSALTEGASYLACDNVEVNPNYRGGVYPNLYATVYRDFFQEYLSRYASRDGLHHDSVPIGMDYSETMSQLPRKKNTFLPRAPLGYSDKAGAEVYELTFHGDDKGFAIDTRDLTHPLRARARIHSSSENPNVSTLTFEDTISVAAIEGKAYKEGISLREHLHNLENMLIAKDIANVKKGRPNLSLRYVDQQSQRMAAYMIAYEGKFNVNPSLRSQENEKGHEPIIHIADLASDRTVPGAGEQLIEQFLSLYKRHYLDNNNPLPIHFYAREKTSYLLMKRKLNSYAKKIGVGFDVEESSTFKIGEDTMHPCMLRPRTEKQAS